MLRSLYIAGTGMLVQRYRMDTITNNIANADTVGYKSDHLLSRSFEDMMLQRLNDPSVISRTNTLGGKNTGIHIDELYTRFVQGGMEQTMEPTDLAIQGDGFFVVNTPNGDRYTRAGNFGVDPQGYLVNPDGHYVMGTNNQRIQVNTTDFAVDITGNVWVGGNNIAQLQIVDFENVDGLRKVGDNLYTHYNNEQPIPAQNITVMQGYIESSNVEIATEMADMIVTNRAYEASQRMVKMVDESLGKTVNEIARF